MFIRLSLCLALLATALAAQSVVLHSVTLSPNNQVRVTYSKSFNTCAHLLTPSNQITHAANFFCVSGSFITVTQPRSSFNNLFVVGATVKLCNGNNYNDCSAPVMITAESLFASASSLPVAAGGTLTFTLEAGLANASNFYAIVGSATGTTPGVPLGAFTLPLILDGYFDLLLSSPNTPPFSSFQGFLSPTGTATAAINLPPGLTFLLPVTLYHAAVVADPFGATLVSSAIPLTFTP